MTKLSFKTSCYRICNVRNCKQVARQYSVSKSHLEVFLVTFGEVVKSQIKPFVCCARNKSVSQSTALSTIPLFSFHKPLQFDSFDICLTNYRSARRMSGTMITYVLLRLRVQNRRKKWNFPLNFRTMRKLSELYSRIFQTQSSGCVSGLDHIRNFTNLKILNI